MEKVDVVEEKVEQTNVNSFDKGKILGASIGTKDLPTLTEKPVTIVAVTLKTETKDGKAMKVPMVQFHCKHPDRDELVIITKAKVLKNDKRLTRPTFVSLDDDGNIQKGSLISDILNALSVGSLSDCQNKVIDTIYESDEEKYLCLKAYK